MTDDDDEDDEEGCVCSSGSSQKHLWSFLADDLGTENEGRHHAEQSD